MTPSSAIDRHCLACGARLTATTETCPICGRPTPQRAARLDVTDPAPVPRRAFAVLIDAAPVIALLAGLLIAAAVTEMASWVRLMLPLLIIAWCLLVWIWESATGQGPGKSLIGLRVLDERTGARIGPARTLGRLVIEAGSVIGTLGVGALSYRWDPVGREQTWWDRVARSRVIAETGDSFTVFDPGAQSRWTPVAPAAPVRAAQPGSVSPSPQAPQAPAAPPAPPSPSAAPAPPDEPTTVLRRQEIRAADPASEAPTTVVGRHALSDGPTSEHPRDIIADATGEEADVTAARAGQAARPATATLEWDSGARVTVGGVVLLGRDPQPMAGERVDRKLSVGADAIGVSKTHLSLTITTAGITVLDRHSTNGTRIERAGGEIMLCAPGEPTVVREGEKVLFGGRSILVSADR